MGTLAQPLGQFIRNRRTDEVPAGLEFISKHIQNRNHNMYQSQYVKHHLKADHRGKMMRNMMEGGGSNCANGACE
jgi:hypothetical protein